MKINTWFGTIETDRDGEILGSRLLSKDIRELALHSLDLRNSRADLPPEGFDLKAAAIRSGFAESTAEYYSLLHEVTLEAAKLQVSGALTPDQRIIQAVEALNDINETTNALSERLSEWYGGYFPESGLGGEDLALFIVKYGSRKNVGSEDPLYSKAINSMGAKLEPADEALLRGFAENVCRLYEQRRQIEAYIENTQPEAYCRPNAWSKVNKSCRKPRKTCCVSLQHHSGYRSQQGSFQASQGSSSISKARDHLQPPSNKHRALVDKGKGSKSCCIKAFPCCTN